MQKELEGRMEKINEIINEMVEDLGYQVVDIHFIKNELSWISEIESHPISEDLNTENDLSLVSHHTSVSNNLTEECWKWKCFSTPTGTKCIKVPC